MLSRQQAVPDQLMMATQGKRAVTTTTAGPQPSPGRISYWI